MPINCWRCIKNYNKKLRSTSFGVFCYLGFDLFEIVLGVVEQLDHHLADVRVEVMTLKGGEGQEACARDHVDAVRRTT